MTAEPAGLGSAAGPAAVTVEVAAEPDAGWLAGYRYRGRELPPVASRLLMSAPWQAFGSVRRDGQVLAVGRVAGSGEWAGLTAIEVHPACRRRGLATAISRALAACAAGRGASGTYLQIEHRPSPLPLPHRAGWRLTADREPPG